MSTSTPHHFGTLLGEGAAVFASDASGAAGDDGRSIRESEIHTLTDGSSAKLFY